MKKALILAGSPGSGKSFVVQNLLDIGSAYTLNQDDHYMALLRENNIPLDYSQRDKEQRSQAAKFMHEANLLWWQEFNELSAHGEDLVLDRTCAGWKTTAKIISDLEFKGYTVRMLLCYAPLNVCLERNLRRERTINPGSLIDNWSKVYSNLQEFKKLELSICSLEVEEEVRSRTFIEETYLEMKEVDTKVQRKIDATWNRIQKFWDSTFGLKDYNLQSLGEFFN